MELKNYISRDKLTNVFFIFCLFSHIYLWDIQNIVDASNKLNFNFNFLRYLILFFLFSFFLRENFSIKSLFDINILIFLSIFFTQFLINYFIYDQSFNLKEISSIIFFFLLYYIVKNERVNIIKNLKLIFEIFILINFLSTIYFIQADEFIIGKACNLFLVESIMYHENSHFAMMATSIFIYYLYIEKNFRNLIFFILIFLLSIVHLSLTFLIGIIFCLLFCLIANFINKENNSIWFLFFLITFIFLLLNNNNCKNRINYLTQKTYYDQEIYFSDENQKEIIKEKSFKKLLTSQNTSSKVYNIAILNTIYTFKNRIFGWGFNSYERLFDFNIMNVMKKYYQIEYEDSLLKNNSFPPLNLNTNDARSTLLKILNEFGIFSIFLLYAGLKFIFNKKIEIKIKMTISTLLITQLISGAGYFNGGFSIFLFLLLVSNWNNLKKN